MEDIDLDFSYDSYIRLIDLLREHNYDISSFHDWDQKERCAILRHDVDFNLDKAVQLARLENKIGVRSTYFVLISCDFYNVFSNACKNNLKEISDLGHEIGLHFDETCYANDSDIEQNIMHEKSVLELAIGRRITTVSMHRPSQKTLQMEVDIAGLVNSYSNVFFKQFKYVSDSRRKWREPVEDIIRSEEFDRLQILTHAFWYDEVDRDIHESIVSYIRKGNEFRFNCLKDNLTDLDKIVEKSEIS